MEISLIMECRMHPVFFGEYLSMKNPKGKQRNLRCCHKCIEQFCQKLTNEYKIELSV
jgi:hypothetical protein